MNIDPYALAAIIAACTAGGMLVGAIGTIVACVKLAAYVDRKNKAAAAAASR